MQEENKRTLRDERGTKEMGRKWKVVAQKKERETRKQDEEGKKKKGNAGSVEWNQKKKVVTLQGKIREEGNRV